MIDIHHRASRDQRIQFIAAQLQYGAQLGGGFLAQPPGAVPFGLYQQFERQIRIVMDEIDHFPRREFRRVLALRLERLENIPGRR
nr:hypothetical protein [Chromobacterium violaceum]